MICRDTTLLRKLLLHAHDDGARPLVVYPAEPGPEQLQVRRWDGSEPSETEQIEIAALEAACLIDAP